MNLSGRYGESNGVFGRYDNILFYKDIIDTIPLASNTGNVTGLNNTRFR